MAYLGVDLGGTNIKAALVTEEGKISAHGAPAFVRGCVR